MIKAIKYFWKEQPIALGVFVISLALLVYFGGRFLLGFIYFHDPAHRNQALEGWMTPRYVSMSYQVPPEIIREVMGIEEKGRMRLHLKDITARLGITMEELEKRVWAAKQAHKAEREAQKAARDAEHEAKRAADKARRDEDRARREAEKARRDQHREAEKAKRDAERDAERLRDQKGDREP